MAERLQALDAFAGAGGWSVACAQLNRKDAETVERIGDRIGANNPALANYLYGAAGRLRNHATELEYIVATRKSSSE